MAEPMVRELTLARTLDAPRDLVWRAWTEPNELKRWFMPHGFTVPECDLDLSVGGRLHMTVRAPDGSEMANDGTFEEIDPPSRLVMTTGAFHGPDGVPALEVRHIVTFDDVDGKTELRVHDVVTKASPEVAAALAGMEEGWLQTLDKLEAAVTGGQPTSAPRQLVATRVLDAPRETVWRAYTDGEQLTKWWPPPGHTIETQEIDVRPGGTWRGTLHGPHGDFEQNMTYVAVQEPQVLAYLYGVPGQPGGVFTTIELADEGGKTTVTVTLAFSSAEERRRMVDEGYAQQGLEGSLDRLASFVAGSA
jgi:uncharacterized protein YndB with AHSA1/START domain